MDEAKKSKGELIKELARLRKQIKSFKDREPDNSMIKSALKKLEKDHFELVDNAPVGVYKTNLSGEILYVNDTLAKILEFKSPKEMKKQNVLVRYKSKNRRNELIRLLKNKGTLSNFEIEAISKSGKIKNILISATLDDSIISGMLIDITERKQAEQAVRDSEAQLRSMLNSMGDAIHVIDRNLEIIMMNKTFTQWNSELGLETNVIGKKLFDIFPFLSEKIEKEYNKVFSSGKTLITEEKTEISGQEFITETRKIPIIENNEVTQVITLIHDISKRKQAEEALKESEERFRGIAEESFDIIFIVDPDGAFSYISPAVKQILGYKPEQLVGLNLNEFLPKSEEEKISHVTKQLMKGGNIHGLELKIPNKYSKSVYFEINANSIVKNGEIIGYQGIARDITERKHTEEEMKKRLMKFKLDEGKVYMVKETTTNISQEAFKELLKVGYPGLVFFRTNPSEFTNLFEGEVQFLWLSENGKERSLHPDLNEIKQMISSVENKKVFYFERFDYIISKHGFKKTLGFVQNLRELAIIYNHIILFSIDPSTQTRSKLRLFEKETNEIEPMLKPKLPEHFTNILKFVYEQNILGNKPSYSEVEQELGKCKPTIRKRIRQLISGGYITENTRGRSKVVELNERGKRIFLK